jgi:hypothetical protein
MPLACSCRILYDEYPRGVAPKRQTWIIPSCPVISRPARRLVHIHLSDRSSGNVKMRWRRDTSSRYCRSWDTGSLHCPCPALPKSSASTPPGRNVYIFIQLQYSSPFRVEFQSAWAACATKHCKKCRVTVRLFCKAVARPFPGPSRQPKPLHFLFCFLPHF